MFEQSIVEARGIAARPWSLAASLTMQTALVSVAIMFPLVHPEMLQKVSVYMPVVSPPHGRQQTTPTRTEVTRTVIARRVMPTGFFAPAAVPRSVPIIVDEPPEVTGPPSGADNGPWVPGAIASDGPVSRIITDLSRPAAVQPRPQAPVTPRPTQQSPAAPTLLKKGGDVQAALLVHGPKPPYPPLARAAHIQGTVHLAAVIATDGTVLDLRARDGHPLLVGAAIDAVKHWVYKPTLLNGEPVEVVTEITVTFTLQ